MKRRAFLKLIIGTTVVATLPVPEFLLPRPKPKYTVPTEGVYDISGRFFSTSGNVLTQETIEAAAQKCLENFGKPETLIFTNVDDYWIFHAQYVKLSLVRET